MDETVILEQARRLANRERQVRAVAAAAGAVLPGAWLALLLVLLLKALGQPAWGALAPLLLLPSGVALSRLLQPLDPIASAYRADRNLGLQERLGTAVEWLLSEKPRTLMAHVMLRDAAARASQVRPQQAFPQCWPGRLRFGILLALLATILAGLPADSLAWRRPDPEVVAAARRQARELREEVRDQQRVQDSPELRDIEARLEALELGLDRPELDPREALELLSALSEELQRRQPAGAGLEGTGLAASDRARQAAEARRLRELARNPESPDSVEALRQMAGNPQASGEAREAARQALEALDGGNPQQAEEILAQGAESTSPGPAEENPGQAVAAGNRSGEAGGEADFGRGTTMDRQQAPPSQPDDYVLERQSQRTSQWSEEYRRLHPPRRDDLATADTRARGRVGPGQTLPETGQALGVPSTGGAWSRQANDSWQQARESAEQAVAREELPADRRGLVRDYFEGIDPRF